MNGGSYMNEKEIKDHLNNRKSAESTWMRKLVSSVYYYLYI